MKSVLRTLAALSTALFFFNGVGRAQTFWTGTPGDGIHWIDGGNWNTLDVPQPGDTVTIGNDSTVVLNGSGSIYSLIVGSGSLSQLTITGVSSSLSGSSGVSFIGGGGSDVGKVTVEDGANWTTTGDLFAGDYGVGTLELTGGATFSGTNLYAGWNEFSSGTITVTGATLSVSGEIGIGNFGTGSLTVGNGGVLTANNIVVGYGNGGSGTLTLGRSDTWGGHTTGSGVALTIGSGGVVTNNGDYYNTLVDLTLSGGQLTSVSGNDDTLYGAWQLKGTVTANGGGTSTIDYSGSEDRARIHLGNNAANGYTTFQVSEGSTLNISNPLADGRDGSNVSVATGLVKTGGGFLILSGANTYSDGTTITSGAVVAAGGFSSASSLGSGSVTVNGLLAGNDYITGAVTINEYAYLSPGIMGDPSNGVLRFDGGLTLNEGAILEFSLSPNYLRMLSMWNESTLTGPSSGTVTIDFYDFGDFVAGTYTLLDFDGAGTVTSFDLADFAVGNMIAGYNFNLAINGTALEVVATAIPEPATYVAIFGAGVLGLAILRRRRLVV